MRHISVSRIVLLAISIFLARPFSVSQGGDVAPATRPSETAAEKKNRQLILFAAHGMPRLATSLIERGADVNFRESTYGETPLYCAASASDEMIDVVKLLIARGADVNVRCFHNSTPLHGACMMGNQKMVEFLISQKVDINAKDDGGNTPMHALTLRVAGERIKICQLLLDAGGDINAPNKNSETPLDQALSGREDALAKFMRQKGAKEGGGVFK